MNKKKDLVEIIKANPRCVAIIDNDSWTLYKVHPNYAPDDGDAYDRWLKENELASCDDVIELGDGYGSGNCYGGDILQALAVIVGITIESV